MANKKKWTLIDTLIVILVAAAAVVGVKMFGTSTGGGEKKKVETQILISNQDKSLAEAMAVGDKVTISLTEKDSAVITDIKVEDAKTLSYDSINGEYKESIITDRYDIYVTVEMEADATDYAYTVGSTIVKVGTSLPVRGKGFATSGYVIVMDEKE